VKFKLYNETRFIYQPSKVPTKIYILSWTHISFKINVSLIQNTCAPQRTNSAPQEALSTVWEPLVWCLDYRPDDRVWIPGRSKIFSCRLCVQTSSGAHPASFPMGTGCPFPRVKRGRGVTLTTHPHLVPRSRMSRSFPPGSCVHDHSGTPFFFSLLSKKWK
jgi:hypothetical protein